MPLKSDNHRFSFVFSLLIFLWLLMWSSCFIIYFLLSIKIFLKHQKESFILGFNYLLHTRHQNRKRNRRGNEIECHKFYCKTSVLMQNIVRCTMLAYFLLVLALCVMSREINEWIKMVKFYFHFVMWDFCTACASNDLYDNYCRKLFPFKTLDS